MINSQVQSAITKLNPHIPLLSIRNDGGGQLRNSEHEIDFCFQWSGANTAKGMRETTKNSNLKSHLALIEGESN